MFSLLFKNTATDEGPWPRTANGSTNYVHGIQRRITTNHQIDYAKSMCANKKLFETLNKSRRLRKGRTRDGGTDEGRTRDGRGTKGGRERRRRNDRGNDGGGTDGGTVGGTEE